MHVSQMLNRAVKQRHHVIMRCASVVIESN